MPDLKPIRLAHELDAAWIITLWKAIHGGDPTPEQIAMEAIAALSGTLTARGGEPASEASFTELQTRSREIGVELERETEAAASSDKLPVFGPVPATFCVIYGIGAQRSRYCFTIPNPRYP